MSKALVVLVLLGILLFTGCAGSGGTQNQTSGAQQTVQPSLNLSIISASASTQYVSNPVIIVTNNGALDILNLVMDVELYQGENVIMSESGVAFMAGNEFINNLAAGKSSKGLLNIFWTDTNAPISDGNYTLKIIARQGTDATPLAESTATLQIGKQAANTVPPSVTSCPEGENCQVHLLTESLQIGKFKLKQMQVEKTKLIGAYDGCMVTWNSTALCKNSKNVSETKQYYLVDDYGKKHAVSYQAGWDIWTFKFTVYNPTNRYECDGKTAFVPIDSGDGSSSVVTISSSFGAPINGLAGTEQCLNPNEEKQGIMLFKVPSDSKLKYLHDTINELYLKVE